MGDFWWVTPIFSGMVYVMGVAINAANHDDMRGQANVIVILGYGLGWPYFAAPEASSAKEVAREALSAVLRDAASNTVARRGAASRTL